MRQQLTTNKYIHTNHIQMWSKLNPITTTAVGGTRLGSEEKKKGQYEIWDTLKNKYINCTYCYNCGGNAVRGNCVYLNT